MTKVGDADGYPYGLVVQSDGRIVVAGQASAASDGGFALVRYSANGTLDPSFGRGGMVFNGAGSVAALAIQRDRKLVTAGTARARYPVFSVARFLEDGSLDEGFGRSGRLTTAFQNTARANAVVVRADGKIVAAGTFHGRDFALARYTSSGGLDRSFGRSGKVLTDFGSVWAARGR